MYVGVDTWVMTPQGPMKAVQWGNVTIIDGWLVNTYGGRTLSFASPKPLGLGVFLPVASEQGYLWFGHGSFMDGYALGSLVGAGTIELHEGNHYPRLQIFELPGAARHSDLIKIRLLEWMNDTDVPEWHKNRLIAWKSNSFSHTSTINWMLRGNKLNRMAADYEIQKGNKTITHSVETASSDFCRGFIRGLMDAEGGVLWDGKATVQITLSNTDVPLLQGLQRMLGRLGIASSIRLSRKAQYRPRTRIRTRKDQWELDITGTDAVRYNERIGFFNTDKKARLSELLEDYQPKIKKRVDGIKEAVKGVYPMVDINLASVDCNGLMLSSR